MASSGKAAAPASCLPAQCFDPLTRSCVKCSDLFKDNTTKPARTVPTSAPAPTLSSVDPPSSLLIFGVPVAVGLILALAAFCGFLACKVRKRRRKKAVDKEAEANMDAAGRLPSPGCQDSVVPAGDATLDAAPCLLLNGDLKVLASPRKAGAKRRPCCPGNGDSDIVLLSAAYPRRDERNPSFPLPATELGATVLVTTKTTQNCASEERA